MYQPNNSISNVAVPEYYGIFRRKVLSGEIPVSHEISLEMLRIDERINNPNIYYWREPVEAFIAFCESEMTKTDGSSIKLLDTFKLWAEQLFGWYYYSTSTVYQDGENSGFVEKQVLKRLINKQYLIVARGAAKTMYQAFVQAYFLLISPETSHQMTIAPTMKQADEVMSPIRTAIIRSQGPLMKFLTSEIKGLRKDRSNMKTLLNPTKKGIEYYITGSMLEVRPMSVDKLQGARPAVATIDEWLSSGDSREDVIGAVEQGASKLDNYVIIAVSSEGTIRNGVGDNIKMELSDILNGVYDAPHVSIFHYKLDNISEIADPRLWVKAQPNLGFTVSYETYYQEVLRAEKVPSQSKDIYAKRFGLPMEGSTYFFTYEEIQKHPKSNYNGMNCSLGIDLSQGDDFCSFLFLFPLNTRGFGIKTLNFISERTYKKLSPASRKLYDVFIKEKSLIVLNGSVLDMTEVYEIVEDEIEKRNYFVSSLGYDPYNADNFIKMWKERNGSYGVEIVRQGVRTESVPLGEIKALSEDRQLFFDESIMSYAMGNTMVYEDSNGNRKIFKKRFKEKIDPVSALLDSYVAYSLHPEMF